MIDYEKVLAENCKTIKPSGIRKFFDIAAMVEGVISLGVGEPDFQTPWAIRQEAINQLEKGKTKYTANTGLAELKETISKYTLDKIGVKYDPVKEICVTVGGSEGIDIALRALVNPGDEVLVIEPCFVCYAPIVTLIGGIPVSLETKAENDFKLMPEQLKEKITDKTKVLILPFPNNPTGAIMTREEYQPIADILKDTDIIVLTDEIYSELTYSGKHSSFASLDGMRERTVVVDGFSKAFSMTGWRMGYVLAPAPLMTQMMKIHQYAIMCAPTISQYAANEAILSCKKDVEKMKSEYDMRRKYLVKALNDMGLECFEPMGAFYVFPSIKSTGLTSEEFCDRLVNEYKVAVVPGDAFGECGEGYIRISYAYSIKHIMDAVAKIKLFVEKVKSEKENG